MKTIIRIEHHEKINDLSKKQRKEAKENKNVI